jgi:hypothetical protein
MFDSLAPYQEKSPFLEVIVPSASSEDGSYRLRMSRAFGDFHFKQHPDFDSNHQAVIAVPTITIHSRAIR